MIYIPLVLLLLSTLLSAAELKITSDLFEADETTGKSIFSGNVMVIKERDELNASSVTIFTDEKNQPIKFVAKGGVSFYIETKKHLKYSGVAKRVIYLPPKQEYRFYEGVHLKQLDEKKEIHGDEVVLKMVDGQAYAKGVEKEPVIMIFNIADEQEE